MKKIFSKIRAGCFIETIDMPTAGCLRRHRVNAAWFSGVDWKWRTWNWRTWKWRTWNWRTIIYRLKIDYITMQCAILFKTTAEYKSPINYSQLKCAHLLENSFILLLQHPD